MVAQSIIIIIIIIIRGSISIITQWRREDGLNSRDSRLGLPAGSSGYVRGGDFVE